MLDVWFLLLSGSGRTQEQETNQISHTRPLIGDLISPKSHPVPTGRHPIPTGRPTQSLPEVVPNLYRRGVL